MLKPFFQVRISRNLEFIEAPMADSQTVIVNNCKTTKDICIISTQLLSKILRSSFKYSVHLESQSSLPALERLPQSWTSWQHDLVTKQLTNWSSFCQLWSKLLRYFQLHFGENHYSFWPFPCLSAQSFFILKRLKNALSHSVGFVGFVGRSFAKDFVTLCPWLGKFPASQIKELDIRVVRKP